MTAEIERHINELLNRILQKSDLHQIIFDINLLTDKISYITITGNNNNENIIHTVRSEIDNLSSDTLKQYFSELLDGNDLWLFEPARYKSFAEEFEQTALKTDFLEITSAIELKPEDVHSLAQEISAKMDRRVIVDIKVSSSLIGGAIIKKDNYILDYSIETKLKNLSERWKASIVKNKK